MTDTTCFFYKIQPIRAEMLADGLTGEEEQIISAHFDYLKHLTEAGVVAHAGRTLNTDTSSFGIVILRVHSEHRSCTTTRRSNSG